MPVSVEGMNEWMARNIVKVCNCETFGLKQLATLMDHNRITCVWVLK